MVQITKVEFNEERIENRYSQGLEILDCEGWFTLLLDDGQEEVLSCQDKSVQAL